MALVPFRPSGPAADQRSEERFFQFGHICVRIKQQPRQSGARRHLQAPARFDPTAMDAVELCLDMDGPLHHFSQPITPNQALRFEPSTCLSRSANLNRWLILHGAETVNPIPSPAADRSQPVDASNEASLSPVVNSSQPANQSQPDPPCHAGSPSHATKSSQRADPSLSGQPSQPSNLSQTVGTPTQPATPSQPVYAIQQANTGQLTDPIQSIDSCQPACTPAQQVNSNKSTNPSQSINPSLPVSTSAQQVLLSQPTNPSQSINVSLPVSTPTQQVSPSHSTNPRQPIHPSQPLTTPAQHVTPNSPTNPSQLRTASQPVAARQPANASHPVNPVNPPAEPIQAVNPIHPDQQPDLSNVGLVVWESGFVLTEFLLRHPPYGQWPGVKVVDLGSGTGLVGIGLALAGAEVILTDLPHITPLTHENVHLNGLGESSRIRVANLKWGCPQADCPTCEPDLITGGDLLYDASHFDDLLCTIQTLSMRHTITYLCYRVRTGDELGLVEKAEAQGFHVQCVDLQRLHDDYQGGSYRIVWLSLLD